jgi:hypothetical protein
MQGGGVLFSHHGQVVPLGGVSGRILIATAQENAGVKVKYRPIALQHFGADFACGCGLIVSISGFIFPASFAV